LQFGKAIARQSLRISTQGQRQFSFSWVRA